MAAPSTEAVEGGVRAADALFAQNETGAVTDVPAPEGDVATAAAVERLGERFGELPWRFRRACQLPL